MVSSHTQLRPLSLGRRIADLLTGRREVGVALLFLLMVAATSAVNRAFLSPVNLRDILVRSVPAAIIGCGVTFVILTGEIDISVGSLMGLLAAILGLTTTHAHLGWPLWLGILATLAMGTAVGFFNGILVTFGRVPSIIVTLAMLTILRGLTESKLVMGGQWITDLPSNLRFLGIGTIAGVRVSLWVALIVVIAAILFARQTPSGRRVYAVGSNSHAAKLAGLSLARTKLLVFTLTGFLVGVATIVSVPEQATIEAGIGKGVELVVVTCVVVGGTSISGGRGTIIGTLLGVLLLGTVRTVLIFLKLGDSAVYWERAIQGAFILAAVLIDHLGRQRGHAEEHA
jgi:ribose/xylose/arabinose/galactoside ABC-type transport system permease subunit